MKQHKFLLALLMLFASGLALAGPDAQDQFVDAIREGADAKQVAQMLAQGADANQPGLAGATPLMVAASTGKPEVVKLLLDKGAQVNAARAEGETALFAAVARRSPEITRLLLDRGADVNAKLADGTPLLQYAIAKSIGPEIVGMLLDKGAEVNARGANGATALMQAAVSGDLEAAELLLAYGADRNLKSANGLTALDVAKKTAHEQLVKLLESNQPVKIDPVVFRQAELVRAIAGGADAKRVTELLGKGADAGKPDRYGQSPMNVAIVGVRPEIVGVLLERGANANEKDATGWTILMWAVSLRSGRSLEIVQLLLEKGAQVNARDTEGKTALMHAIFVGNLEAVRLLLAHGADRRIKDAQGVTALDMAQEALKFRNKSDMQAIIALLEAKS